MRIAKNYPITFFLVAAFVITYPLGIGAFLAVRALQSSVAFDVSWAGELLLKFGPSLAGLLTIALTVGGRGVRQLLRRCAQWRGPTMLYVAAILVQPAVLICVLLIQGYGAQLSEIHAGDALAVFSMQLLLNVFLGGGLSEELGWRGFLLPKLCARHSLLLASLLVGVAWFAWHVPAYILFDKSTSDPILPFAVILFPFSVVLAWSYYRSQQSLSLPILLHGSINAAFYALEDLLPSVTEADGFQPAFDWWLALLWCVLAVVVVANAAPLFTRAPTAADGARP